jgi:hypothetical protein
MHDAKAMEAVGEAAPAEFNASDFVEEVEARLNAQRVMNAHPNASAHRHGRAHDP